MTVNNKFHPKLILSFLLFASFSALAGAYISQYFFGLQPCPLCLYQRIPYFLVIFIILFTIFLKKEEWLKIIIKITLLILIFNGFLALYHVGVEQKIFIFDKCANLISNTTNLEDLKQQLLQTKAVRCDEPQFILFGISMAGWNAIYCFGLVLLNFSLKFLKK